MAPSTDLVTVDKARETYPQLFADGDMGSLQDIIDDNLDGEGLRPSDMGRIKIPAGGSKFWDMGEGKRPEDTIEGIVVLHDRTRSMYLKGFDESTAEEKKNPPDCSSVDAKTGYGLYGVGSDYHPSGVCADCPMNKFESAKNGTGKACSEQKPLWIMLAGAMFPIQVRVSPGSLKAWRTYMADLVKDGLRYSAVVTKLTLIKVSSANGTDYSQVVFTRGDVLDSEVAAEAAKYGRALKAMLDVAKEAQVAAAQAASDPAEAAAAAAGTTTTGTPSSASGDAWGEDEEPPYDEDEPTGR